MLAHLCNSSKVFRSQLQRSQFSVSTCHIARRTLTQRLRQAEHSMHSLRSSAHRVRTPTPRWTSLVAHLPSCSTLPTFCRTFQYLTRKPSHLFGSHRAGSAGISLPPRRQRPCCRSCPDVIQAPATAVSSSHPVRACSQHRWQSTQRISGSTLSVCDVLAR